MQIEYKKGIFIMVIILKENPEKKQFDNLVAWLKSMDLTIHMSQGIDTTILGLVGDTSEVDADLINALDIVKTVKRISTSITLK